MFRNPGVVAFSALLSLFLATGLLALPGNAAAYTFSGHVSFQGLTQVPPYPLAAVVLYEAGSEEPFAYDVTDPATSAFELADIPAGLYDIEVVSTCWETYTVTYQLTGDVYIGTFELSPSTSSFDTIRMVGSFNGWSLSAPVMSFDGACTWSDTLTLQSGSHLFKFVTDGAWDNDYGGVQSTTLDIPGGPFTAAPGVSGEGTAISIQATLTGDYRFTLSEAGQTWSAEYLGIIPQGSVTGTVAFTGLTTAPYPAATVQLLQGGTSTVVRTTTSDPTTRAFTFNSVADGTYDVKVLARCFADGLETGVAVSGAAVDVGDITLAAAGSSFSTILLASDFTSWDLGSAPGMTQNEDCVWSVQGLVTAGTYYMKFVTNGAWGNDYGGNQSVTFTAPGTYPVTPGVSGENAIKIQFTQDDTYTFTLDEGSLQFTVTGTTPVEKTTWGAIKARY